MAGYLKLNGIRMPDPKLEGVEYGEEKIWSKNTARTTANAKMVGDIKAIKKTIKLEFPPLKPSQIDLLNSVLSNKNLPFFSYELYYGEGTVEKMVYAGTPGYKLYSTVKGIRYYTGYKIELVEQ